VIELRVVLVQEDAASGDNARHLADRLLRRHGYEPFWGGLTNERAESFRSQGKRPKFGSGAHRRARAFGRNGGECADKLAQWVTACVDIGGVQLLVVAFDQDRKPSRRTAVGTAHAEADVPLACALMNPEAEAWRIVVAPRRAEVVDRLAFDPWREPERMTSTSGRPERDVKAIARLVGISGWTTDFDGVVDGGWTHLPASSGMPQFLDRIVELFPDPRQR
jgi:hypothetical protein